MRLSMRCAAMKGLRSVVKAQRRHDHSWAMADYSTLVVGISLKAQDLARRFQRLGKRRLPPLSITDRSKCIFLGTTFGSANFRKQPDSPDRIHLDQRQFIHPVEN